LFASQQARAVECDEIVLDAALSETGKYAANGKNTRDGYEFAVKRVNEILSGGERRMLEIARALMMNPQLLLVDEPPIGLEPRFIDLVFELLDELQHRDGKTIVMVEQNAKRGLEFADIGYVLVSGRVAVAGTGKEVLQNPAVGRLFLGG
jgi:branched-chain amino acid transport system ATP-binding protein